MIIRFMKAQDRQSFSTITEKSNIVHLDGKSFNLKYEKQTHHQKASPQMVSRNDYCEPQHNLLPQQNSPVLDKALLYVQGHILEQEFHTFQDACVHKIKILAYVVKFLQSTEYSNE